MRAIDMLLDRVSVSALQDPAPDGATLDRILEAGLRAPDHGKLRPWRFVLVRGDARFVLADIVVRALLARDPDASTQMADKQRSKFTRAPLVIALGVHVLENHKIPEIEQLLSGAAATMNLLNAIHAEGFGAIWVTGANAYDPTVGAALGFTRPDRLIGFLFVGTRSDPQDAAARPVNRPALSDHVIDWSGPASAP
jgi:nitroreductase